MPTTLGRTIRTGLSLSLALASLVAVSAPSYARDGGEIARDVLEGIGRVINPTASAGGCLASASPNSSTTQDQIRPGLCATSEARSAALLVRRARGVRWPGLRRQQGEGLSLIRGSVDRCERPWTPPKQGLPTEGKVQYIHHEQKLFHLRETPMRRFLALMCAVLALSMVSPAVACPAGTHPCGPACCPN